MKRIGWEADPRTERPRDEARPRKSGAISTTSRLYCTTSARGTATDYVFFASHSAEGSALLIPTATQFQASYPRIGCQARIFHGDKDQVIEAKQARDLHGVLYTSDLHLVPNAGHMVTYADTAAIAQSVSSLGTANLRQSFTLGRQEKDTTRTPGAL